MDAEYRKIGGQSCRGVQGGFECGPHVAAIATSYKKTFINFDGKEFRSGSTFRLAAGILWGG